MLKKSKQLIMRAASSSGLSSLLLNSGWRQKRLLILCYHGTSIEDEHLWNSSLYMAPSVLRARLRTLKDLKCNVLPLGEAIAKLYSGTLPERAIVITVDDGSFDFYDIGYPIFREFDYPVTVYYTTYYSEYNRPVFDTMCSYITWKARGGKLDWPELGLDDLRLDEAGRECAVDAIKFCAARTDLSGPKKDCLIAELAARVKIDYEILCRKRILHLMTPSEATELSAMGVDFQLHTHRHRTSRERGVFIREIVENRCRIEAVSGAHARHFCYPSGFHLPEYSEWLRAEGVVSGTTCEPRLATMKDDPMLLPRLVDSTGLSLNEFRACIAGFADFLPRRLTESNIHEAIS